MTSRAVFGRQILVLSVIRRCYSAESGANVAFLGLGNMGQHMAGNLVKKGFKVRGYDASPEAVKMAASQGVTPGVSVADAVQGAAFVVSALPNNEIVRNVYLGEGGVVANVPKGALLIDSSTVEPVVSQEVAKVAQEKGLSFIDAPVSGGVMGAKNATLAFMVGGKKADLSRASPLLTAMGARHVHCGDVGSGEVVKLCNNLLMAINVLGTAECMNMGIRMGIDPKALHEVINSSSGKSWATEVYCPVPGLCPNAPSSNDYNGGFKNDLLVKDLQLATKIALSSQSPNPLGALTTQFYKLLQTKGFGGKDFTYVYPFLKEQ